ncbi:MAG: cob(I)yrinic acid a,c-diamide adenosyltransferase [Porticoccaceae bacterium]|nr:cob(I)yrinic acid a,c-diamide adenosyltransferase [Porticoccaceae bacterium]
MTRIYTRTGDKGSTGLADGTRTTKTSVRIEAIGTVDECNSHLGLLISLIDDQALATNLSVIQHQLFDLGATLAGTPSQLIEARHVEVLEQWIDELEQALPPLRQFILPGGNTATAQAHITRAVCRRAERCTFKIVETESSHAREIEVVPDAVVQFLNRLSDYLFLVARTLSNNQPTHDSTAHNDPSHNNPSPNNRETPWLPEGKRSS